MSSKKQAGSSRINPNLVAALAYAARGWHIYPSFPGTKAKTNLKWRTDSTDQREANHALVDEVAERNDLPGLRKIRFGRARLDQKDGKDGRLALTCSKYYTRDCHRR